MDNNKKYINWEERRFELTEIYIKERIRSLNGATIKLDNLADSAVYLANKVIKELKNTENEII